MPRAVRTSRPRFGRPAQLSATQSQPAPQTPWQTLEAADYRQFIANLRVAGCPEQTIRDIVLVRMSAPFSAGCWISRRSNAGIELLAGP